MLPSIIADSQRLYHKIVKKTASVSFFRKKTLPPSRQISVFWVTATHIRYIDQISPERMASWTDDVLS